MSVKTVVFMLDNKHPQLTGNAGPPQLKWVTAPDWIKENTQKIHRNGHKRQVVCMCEYACEEDTYNY